WWNHVGFHGFTLERSCVANASAWLDLHVVYNARSSLAHRCSTKYSVQLCGVGYRPINASDAFVYTQRDVEAFEAAAKLFLCQCGDDGIGDLAISSERRHMCSGGQRGDRHAHKKSTHGNPPTVFLREKRRFGAVIHPSAPANFLARCMGRDFIPSNACVRLAR